MYSNLHHTRCEITVHQTTVPYRNLQYLAEIRQVDVAFVLLEQVREDLLERKQRELVPPGKEGVLY